MIDLDCFWCLPGKYAAQPLAVAPLVLEVATRKGVLWWWTILS